MRSADADFSAKVNDKKAQTIASRLVAQFPPGSVAADRLSPLCAYLSDYAKLSYADSMTVLSRLGFTGSPSDWLRLAYALIHFTHTGGYGQVGKYSAHAKIVRVTADGIQSRNPRICLRFLLVSSPYAGGFIDYEVSIRDAVKLHKKVYSGRSKLLAGRSLLEFVGAICTITAVNDAVQSVDATTEEKRFNKQLCTDRAKADTECAKAASCVHCKERRASCRLAVRY